MGTISQKLQRLKESKAAIKAAIISKGVAADDILGNYAGFINNIQTGGELNFTKIGYSVTPAFIIDGLAYADKIKKSWDDAALKTNMLSSDDKLIFLPSLSSSMDTPIDESFSKNPNLLIVGDINFPNVTSTHQVFLGDRCVKEFGRLIFTKSIYCRQMFENMAELEKISYLDVSVGGLGNTFTNLPKLRYLELKFGYRSDVTTLNMDTCPLWGVNNDKYPDAEAAMKKSLLVNTCDRAKLGFPVMTITLASATKALLTQDEISRINAKGYTIA